MQYRERIPESETDWIRERIEARNEMYQDWATFLGMKKYMFSKILSQVKPLPEKYESKWIEMEEYLKGEEPCAIIRQKNK